MDLQDFLAPYRTPVDCVFDVETFYVKGKGPKSYSVQNMTTWQYVHDPRFDAYLTAVYAPDYQQVVPTPEFDWSYLDGKVVGAHNAGFDELVFNRLKELKIVPASCNPKRWVCTADMAAYYRVKRSLANAAKVMLDISLDKGVRDRMSGKTLQNARDEGFYDELIAYGASDARVSYQLAEKYLAGWPDWEQWLSEEMRHRGWAGVHIDQPYLRECIEKLEVVRFEAGQKIPWDWDETKTPLAAAKMREQCRIEGIWCPESFAKTDERCEIWEEEFSDRFPWVRAVRDWRRANTYLKKFQKIQSRVREDGTAPFTHKYFGAHCLPGASEVLTKQGWVRLDDWNGGEIVQWTPDYKLQFLPATANRFSVPEGAASYELTHAFVRGVFSRGHTVPYFSQAGRFLAAPVEQVAARAITYMPTAGTLALTGRLTPDQIKLLVAVQADGYWEKDPEGATTGALMFVLRKERKRRRLAAIFNALDIPFTTKDFPCCRGQFRFRVKKDDCPSWLTPDKKIFGPWLLDSTEEARAAAIEEVFLWDGWVSKNGLSWTYYSSEKANAEWVVTLAHLTGLSATMHVKLDQRKLEKGKPGKRRPVFIVGLRRRSYSTPERHDWKPGPVLYDVFCPSTQTGFFLYRHCGCVGVTGNSGRPTADEGFNNLNLERKPKFGADIRKVIVAPKGCVFILPDLCQIEPRVLHLVAGDYEFLDAVKTQSPYLVHARRRGYDGPDDLKRLFPNKYQLYKASELALGYGAGWQKFIAMIRLFELDPYEIFEGVPRADETALFLDYLTYLEKKDTIAEFNAKDERTRNMWVTSWLQVRDYRAKNPLIVGLWRTCHTDLQVSANHREDYVVTMPSGRKMAYFRPIVRGKEIVAQLVRGEDPRYVYGGRVVENIVQATARDIFDYGRARIAAAGHNCLYGVYDEYVVVSPENEAADRAKDIVSIIKTQPEWVRCPIDVEYQISDCYVK